MANLGPFMLVPVKKGAAAKNDKVRSPKGKTSTKGSTRPRSASSMDRKEKVRKTKVSENGRGRKTKKA